MAKGYWIIHADVNDVDAFERYRAANEAAFAAVPHRYLVRGGKSMVREGNLRSRTVIIEFPSYAAAVALYEAPATSDARALRQQVLGGLTVAEVDLLIVEGT